MPGGSPALVKTRRHLRRDQAEKFWKELVVLGGEGVNRSGALLSISERVSAFDLPSVEAEVGCDERRLGQ